MSKATDDILALIDGALDDDEYWPDAMRWSPGPVADPPPPADIRVGDVVDYHGSITTHHGEFVVAAVDGARLTLRDHWSPDIRLSRVRLASVTPKGEWVPVCRCGHPHTHPGTGATGSCPRIGCQCPHHP